MNIKNWNIKTVMLYLYCYCIEYFLSPGTGFFLHSFSRLGVYFILATYILCLVLAKLSYMYINHESSWNKNRHEFYEKLDCLFRNTSMSRWRHRWLLNSVHLLLLTHLKIKLLSFEISNKIDINENGKIYSTIDEMYHYHYYLHLEEFC